jgi:hypothetical protein
MSVSAFLKVAPSLGPALAMGASSSASRPTSRTNVLAVTSWLGTWRGSTQPWHVSCQQRSHRQHIQDRASQVEQLHASACLHSYFMESLCHRLMRDERPPASAAGRTCTAEVPPAASAASTRLFTSSVAAMRSSSLKRFRWRRSEPTQACKA